MPPNQRKMLLQSRFPRGRGYQNLSKAGYDKTGAQLRVRVRKMKRGGYPAKNGRR